jgi:AcrR family transcriptional regulator
MTRQRLSLRGVTESAVAVVDSDGFNALNLSRVAQVLGVGPSALYTHVNGLDGLRCLVAIQATTNLTSQVRNAAIGVAGDSAVYAVGDAYRGFALGFPGQFASMLLPPLADGELAQATSQLLDVFALVFRGVGLDSAESTLAAGSARSAIHGFLALELATGTTSGHDAQYRHLLDTITFGLLSPRPQARE